MDSDILHNFERHVFYHGTRLSSAHCIATEGFRTWFEDEDDGRRYTRNGVLGKGLYISCNWRTALWFAPVLLRVSLQPGTRLLNAALPPNQKVIKYLQKEFGREVLRKAPWKVIPANKRLTLRELVELFRYHYWHTWEKPWALNRHGDVKWPARRETHFRNLSDYKKLLVRYGFDGFGNPDDENGIIVFADDKLCLEQLVAEIPLGDFFDDNRAPADVKQLEAWFQRHGSAKTQALARYIERQAQTRAPTRATRPARRARVL